MNADDRFSLEQLAHDHSPGNDGEISRQTAFASEPLQDCEFVIDNCQEHFGRQILTVLVGQANGPRLGGVIDHMHYQAQESIDEIFPGARRSRETAFDQVAVEIREGH
jgi:hypothetical protein